MIQTTQQMKNFDNNAKSSSKHKIQNSFENISKQYNTKKTEPDFMERITKSYQSPQESEGQMRNVELCPYKIHTILD